MQAPGTVRPSEGLSGNTQTQGWPHSSAETSRLIITLFYSFPLLTSPSLTFSTGLSLRPLVLGRGPRTWMLPWMSYSCLPQGWAWLPGALGSGSARPSLLGPGSHPRSSGACPPRSLPIPGGAVSGRVNDCSGEAETVPKSVSCTLRAPEGAHLCLPLSVRRFRSPFGAQVGTTELR